MVKQSLVEFAAAMAPKSKGSSTMGVKKSTVWTMARSSRSLYTPVSSPGLVPNKTFGSMEQGSPSRATRRSSGPILLPHPPAFTRPVSKILSSLEVDKNFSPTEFGDA